MAALTLLIAKPWLVREFATFLVALDDMYNRSRLFDDMLKYREKPPADFLLFLQSAAVEAERRFPGERLAIAKIVIQSDGLVNIEDGGEFIKEMRETIRYLLYGRKYDKRLEEIRVKKEELELSQRFEKGNIELQMERAKLEEEEAKIHMAWLKVEKLYLENLERKKQFLKGMGYSEEEIRKIMAEAMAPNDKIRRLIERGKIVEALEEAEEVEVVDKE